MANNPYDAPLANDRDELVARLAALHAFAIYAQAPLLWALVEQKSVDLARVLAFDRMIAEVFRLKAATTAQGEIAARGHTIAAQMLDELEAAIRNMGTKPPPGAGTA